MRQDQLLFISKVPKVTPAAMIAPTNQEQLKREVMIGRSLGCASSPIKELAATIAKGIP